MAQKAWTRTQVATRVRIDVSAARAWQLLRNLEVADRYVPGVRSCTITSATREGVGASRRIEQSGRPPMQETVIEWSDGAGFTLQLTAPDSGRAPAPFTEARFRYRIAPAEAGSTEAELALSYKLRGGALGRLLDTLVLRGLVRKQVEGIATRMKAFYEAQG